MGMKCSLLVTSFENKEVRKIFGRQKDDESNSEYYEYLRTP
jgi:hypothetical protein